MSTIMRDDHLVPDDREADDHDMRGSSLGCFWIVMGLFFDGGEDAFLSLLLFGSVSALATACAK